ncbi:MAG: hypothetical protein PHW73_14085, partial [Atribacterota bacterium]|nr:hypothetical protein [Atribacterota bacterium]
YQYLKKQLPDVDSNIRFVIPIMLDKVSVEIGSWSGYNVLAQHQIRILSSESYLVKIIKIGNQNKVIKFISYFAYL